MKKEMVLLENDLEMIHIINSGGCRVYQFKWGNIISKIIFVYLKYKK